MSSEKGGEVEQVAKAAVGQFDDNGFLEGTAVLYLDSDFQ
jgi:hypothetical protein